MTKCALFGRERKKQLIQKLKTHIFRLPEKTFLKSKKKVVVGAKLDSGSPGVGLKPRVFIHVVTLILHLKYLHAIKPTPSLTLPVS